MNPDDCLTDPDPKSDPDMKNSFDPGSETDYISKILVENIFVNNAEIYFLDFYHHVQ